MRSGNAANSTPLQEQANLKRFSIQIHDRCTTLCDRFSGDLALLYCWCQADNSLN
jgi:hypothetical protein